MSFNIAIDGPAGAGKSTIAKLVAKKLGFVYVDTGAMYRAMGLYFSRNQIDVKNMEAVLAACRNVVIRISYEDGAQQVWLNDENVTALIRTTEAGNMASAVAVIPEVRKKLVELQQAMAKTTDVVMDGRDICMWVLPDAQVKVFLTASVEARAERRYKEYLQNKLEKTLEEVKQEVIDRDYNDSHRDASPLVKAPDAVLLDNSFLDIEESAQAIIDLVDKARA